ncbi:MAG TPA: DUF6789 family protein [Burkholderiales bacterium]|nr:DUF6789 family protein [Burkholderiales bacterium]
MVSIRNGLISAIFATLAAGSMMLMNNALHRVPELHLARTLAAVLGYPDRLMVGWIAFLVLGILVFGVLFAVLAPKLPVRSYLVKGLIFGVMSWLLMMVVIMPLAGAGFFGVTRGHILALAALVLNLVYWIVLSLIYRSDIEPGVSAVRIKR